MRVTNHDGDGEVLGGHGGGDDDDDDESSKELVMLRRKVWRKKTMPRPGGTLLCELRSRSAYMDMNNKKLR